VVGSPDISLPVFARVTQVCGPHIGLSKSWQLRDNRAPQASIKQQQVAGLQATLPYLLDAGTPTV